MGAIALLGVVFALSGCAEKAYIDARKENCNVGKSDGEYLPSRDGNAQLLHNDCLEVAGAYRQQKDEAIGLGKRGKEEYGHYAGLKVDNDYIAGDVYQVMSAKRGYQAILRMNNSHGVTKASEKTSKEYLEKGIEQLRERIAKPDQENPEKCYVIQDGAALNILRDELHKLQLGCIELKTAKSRLADEYLVYDTPSLRAALYQYADFAPKQIEEALRKDYPLRAELVSKACKLYGDKYIAVDFDTASPENIRHYCNEAQELYTKGGSYNGIQVFAPNPHHQNAKIVQNMFIAIDNRDKQAQKQVAKMEDEEGLQTDREIEEFERSLDMQEAEDQQYQKSVAKDCKTKYKNAKLCEIATQEMLRFRLEKRGLEQTSEVMFQDIKIQVKSYDIKTLRVIMQEIKNKPKHKYKDVSYCRSVVPYVWNALNWHDEVNISMKDYVAGICGKN